MEGVRDGGGGDVCECGCLVRESPHACNNAHLSPCAYCMSILCVHACVRVCVNA